MNEVTIREPVQLIDEDLDAVAGGFDVNIADIDQFIRQTQANASIASDVDQTQSAANVATVAQVNN